MSLNQTVKPSKREMKKSIDFLEIKQATDSQVQKMEGLIRYLDCNKKV